MRSVCTAVILAFAVAWGLPTDAAEREGYVLKVEGRLVFLDVGTQDNVHPNSFLQVVRQETIIHPVTGENLGGQIPLGAVRIVEVFPRLCTAEVVDLVREMDLEMLDQEAKQGKIMVRPLPEDLEETLRTRIEMAPQGGGAQMMSRGPLEGNPDGPLGSLVPHLQMGFGSRILTAVPDTVYQLIPQDVRAQADPDSAQTPLGEINGANDIVFSLQMPVSERLTASADVQVGGSSRIAVGGSYYPGPVLGFLGEGRNPEGQIGEPAITLMIGRGGRGATTLPVSTLGQIVARSDSTFLASLDSAFVTLPLDSLTQVALADTLSKITGSLRQATEQSFTEMSKRGLGFAIGISLPVSRKLSFRLGMTRMGSISELTGGLTYFLKAVAPGEMGTNPDGAIRSPVFALDATSDGKAKTTFYGLNLKLPIATAYTLSLGAVTDLGSYKRFGLSLKGYLNVF